MLADGQDYRGPAATLIFNVFARREMLRGTLNTRISGLAGITTIGTLAEPFRPELSAAVAVKWQ